MAGAVQHVAEALVLHQPTFGAPSVAFLAFLFCLNSNESPRSFVKTSLNDVTGGKPLRCMDI